MAPRAATLGATHLSELNHHLASLLFIPSAQQGQGREGAGDKATEDCVALSDAASATTVQKVQTVRMLHCMAAAVIPLGFLVTEEEAYKKTNTAQPAVSPP